ncbi:hypothetical protein DW322_00960 [Rhodococcus rhodnii]|uniref:Gp28/Gp37-like domain-containing protein n=2 Tax=Rhodococcus rhodnii TaxID=38312 RepID=R7WPP2_9NOCA|nr:hypothetical protein [Rhodococcus rhodnii]EOM77277.1 hypothetical protein Rrhod_1366 [Rhodococcus rhodnii LMG 5362]TXG89073.1 hypothetical protein DW322_00960 [Rhodococcus rhodnii]
MGVLDAISRGIDVQRAARKRQVEQTVRDRIVLCDKEWEYVADVTGEESADFGELVNDTDEGRFTLFGDHPLVDWLIYQNGLDEDIHFYVENEVGGPEDRMGYKVLDIEVEFDADDGIDRVTVIGLHDFEHVKNLLAKPNTAAPLEAQIPKSDVQAGRSRAVIASYLQRNLGSEQQPLLIWGFDMWTPLVWRQIDPSRWKVIVAPPKGRDESEHTILSARMDNMWDLVKATLEDASLQIVPQRWLPGDPQPFPEHLILTHPILVLHIVQRSFLAGTGSAVGDIVRDVVRAIGADGASETITIADPNSAPPPDGVNAPTVIWRASQHQGIVGSKMTLHHATGHTVIIGGKSPQWVNNSIKLLLNSALGYIGLAIGIPGLAIGIFDKAVEDQILAWQRFTNWIRKSTLGSHAYIHTFAQGDAWTLGGLQSGRVGLHGKRGFAAFTARVIDMQPYVMGRDYRLGWRVGVEVANRIWLSHIARRRRHWDRDTPPSWDITIGDSREDELPGTTALRHLETVRGEIVRYTSLV